jgi:hypothetical protein
VTALHRLHRDFGQSPWLDYLSRDAIDNGHLSRPVSMVCDVCGTENREGRKFCKECGSALALVSANCRAANDAGDKFCGDCGQTLGTRPDATGVASPAPAKAA